MYIEYFTESIVGRLLSFALKLEIICIEASDAKLAS